MTKADQKLITRRAFAKALGAGTVVAGAGVTVALGKEPDRADTLVCLADEYRSACDEYEKMVEGRDAVPVPLRVTRDRSHPVWDPYFKARDEKERAESRLCRFALGIPDWD